MHHTTSTPATSDDVGAEDAGGAGSDGTVGAGSTAESTAGTEGPGR